VHCILGSSPDTTGELRAEDYVGLIKSLRAAGVFNVYLTGGEFLAHPEGLEILSLFLESDFCLSLQSNGTLIDEEALRMMLGRKEKIRTVALSIYGATADVHEAVTRTPGSFEKTIAAARALRENGFRVEFITLLMTINHHQYDEIKKLGEGLGSKHQFNSVLTPSHDGNRELAGLRLPEALLAKLPRPWESFMNNYWEQPLEEFGPDMPLAAWCSMGRTTGYIDARGNVLPCSILNTPAGNVRETPFNEIWEASPVLKKIRSLKIGDFECSRCSHFPTCRPCPGLAHFEHGDLFSPPREICRIIEVFLGKKKETPVEEEKDLLKTGAN